MQARRRAQPSGTNSPSSSHPRLKHRARCAIFIRARHAAARVAPDRGSWQARILEPRGSAPRERDHRGGDHPVPSRTRQLSPPSPRVLQREAAGGQGVALAEGAFLSVPGEARGGGMLPPAGLFCVLRRSRSRRQRCELCRCLSALRGPLLGGPIHGLRRWPAFFRCAPLPDSAFCWSPKGSLMAIISKLCTVHWRNAGVWECAIYDIGIALPALAGSDADLPKTVGESALRQALSSLES